ncbi:DMT family transporter [Gymnodinialimonas ceratoperidinii]|uniref:DMT family transporter n=1 Tax=Gymnodinialimonas ceratoperidinii TaxID=2856823 RepID=A0A8F6TYZ6_9RHOB|nr:DMT family transporter [Gymnodinialimonas ceratoperidinii]QXT41486.1 DMT family transporter [Gymnodinialimonas ceratoperidinii]
MLAFSALVAGSFSLGGQVADELAPTALNAVRFAIAAAIMGAVVFARGGVPRAALAAPWRYVLLGGIFAFYFVLMFEGLKTAPPVSAAAVFTLTPVLSAIFGWFLLRQVVSARIAGALGIGALGAAWVIFRADLAALLAFEIGRGEVIYFIGCVGHALYTPMVRVLNRGEAVAVFSFLTLVACAAVIALWGIGDIAATDWGALRPLVWITIGYTAVFASAATVFLIQFASLRLPSSKVMAYTYLTPSWVILWEIALGQPVPAAVVLVGVGLTVAALLLLLKD